MKQLIECVPNFSEGNNKEILSAISHAIEQVDHVSLLHTTSDQDHNRSVFTFIGSPQAVTEAAFQAAKVAASLIDITKHSGVHPRIGATDVLPLIPLKGISTKELIKYGEALGTRIAEELGIPIYFYEKLAKKNEHKNLAYVRKNAHKTAPNLGPKKWPKAGAICLGVRDFLIAFNINLQTPDLKIAKEIAKNIRESSGGLPGVKALGLELKSQNKTQVSLNLVNFRTTSPKEVFEKVKELAKKHQVTIAESELIGMIPREAWFEDAENFLQIKDFLPSQILNY